MGPLKSAAMARDCTSIAAARIDRYPPILGLHLEERERLGRRNERARRVRREPEMTRADPFDLERLVTAPAGR
jgi:hypothetical protein